MLHKMAFTSNFMGFFVCGMPFYGKRFPARQPPLSKPQALPTLIIYFALEISVHQRKEEKTQKRGPILWTHCLSLRQSDFHNRDDKETRNSLFDMQRISKQGHGRFKRCPLYFPSTLGFSASGTASTNTHRTFALVYVEA